MMRRVLLLTVMVLAAAAAHAVAADDFCGLAVDMEEKAAATYAKDQPGGLKLFIKAAELCPTSAEYAFNLGVAYYRYGRFSEARQPLESAVRLDGRHVAALNNLAQVLLELDTDRPAALRHAEAAARLDTSAAVQETLARARFANGQEVAALKGLHEVLVKGDDKRLQAGFDDLLDRYLAAQLKLARDGQPQVALEALARVDFAPAARRARIRLLAVRGDLETALKEIAEARRLEPSDRELPALGEEVARQTAAALYADFQAGRTAEATRRARRLADQFPDSTVLKETAGKLFEALVADTHTIEVPAAVAAPARQAAGGGRAEEMLAGMTARQPAAAADADLAVDVDKDIPAGVAGGRAGRYDVAVVIGNRDYQNAPAVDFAARDARIMREYLVTTMGFDRDAIIYAENAGYARFNEIFGTERDPRGQLFNSVKAGESRVFVYYVGHGAPDLDSGEAYFVPVDANPQYLRASGYRAQTFYNNLGRLPAKELTVVLDACFSGNAESGMLFKGISPALVKVDRGLSGPGNAAIFTSGQVDQVSSWYPAKRHSLFTYFFLKGLRGEADADRDKRITSTEMKAWLDDNVPWMARKLKGITQQPQVSGAGERVLAVLR